MVDRAATELGICLADSFVIGDKRSDVELAFAIGATGILITTDRGRLDVTWAAGKICFVATNFLDAAHHVVRAQSCAPNPIR